MPTVSDTSPVSNLAIIEQLNLLQEQFGRVWIPEAVFRECDQMWQGSPRDSILQAIASGWLIVAAVRNRDLVSSLLFDLDLGEAEAIAMAVEMSANLLLIDELEGRRVARQSALRVRGVLGILLRAKNTGRLDRIRPSIELLRNRARFFIATDLEERILSEAGELQGDPTSEGQAMFN
jgi:predicted nucleic acid-binding protein